MGRTPGEGTPRSGKHPVDRWLLTAAGIALLLALWALVSLVGRSFVPGPWTTLADTAALLARGDTWRQVGITMMRVCLGFAAGYATGVAIGMAVGSRRGVDALLKPTVLFFQGMPPLLWAIPIVVVLGIGHLPTILVIALITFPNVTVTVAEGMRTLPRELGEMLSLFAPGPRARLRELVCPPPPPVPRRGAQGRPRARGEGVGDGRVLRREQRHRFPDPGRLPVAADPAPLRVGARADPRDPRVQPPAAPARKARVADRPGAGPGRGRGVPHRGHPRAEDDLRVEEGGPPDRAAGCGVRMGPRTSPSSPKRASR